MANTGNTQQQIDYGAAVNDGTGDPLRTAFIKTDDNFDNIWLTGPVGSNITIINNTVQANNTNGNLILSPNGTGVVQTNSKLLPRLNNTYDLGSSALKYRAGYFGAGGLTVDGNVTITGNLTAGNISYTSNVFVGDLQGSVFADDSTIMVDAIDNVLYAGRAAISGNVSATYFIGNGSQLTGLAATYGNANVVANLAALGSNPVSTTGNISGNFFVGNGRSLTGITSSYGNANVVANLSALGSNPVSTTGNISGNYFIGNGSQLTGMAASYGNANVVANLSALGSNPVSTTGNVTASYFIGNGSLLTGLPAPAVTQDITSNGAMSLMTYDGVIKYVSYATVEPSSGNLTAGNVSSTGNVTAGNLIATGNIVLTGSLVGTGASPAPSLSGFSSVSAVTLSATGNVTSGNVSTGVITLTNGAVIKDTTGLAIGYQAGYTGQRQNAVAIGVQAGYTGQGNNAVAIGTFAGGANQGNNSIILNATGDAVNQTTANTFTVAPVRNDVANIGNVMFYNTTSKEITYGNTITVAGNITGGNLITTGSGGDITMSGGSITGTGNISAGNVSTTGNVTAANFIGNGNTLSNVATQVTGTWTVPVGNSTQSFTVSNIGTYSMWVDCNITNGILAWNATATVTNNNVPVVGAQYAWVYSGGGTPVDFTSIPNQFTGTANTIVRSSTAPSATTNRFDFGINNTSGNTVTVRYGYTKIS